MVDPGTDLRRQMEQLELGPFTLDDFHDRRERKRRNQRIAAGVVGIGVFAAAVWIVTTGWTTDRGQTPGGAGSTGPTGVTVAPAPDRTGLPGLPAEDAIPSSPATGELVLSLDGHTGSPASLWVFEDGRFIWTPYSTPPDLPGSATNLYEQHLTPEGVDYLRSAIVSTGLFEDDLELLDPEVLPIGIRVRSGDRLVEVSLDRPSLEDIDAPAATREQERILIDLAAFLTDPDAWPAEVWADPTVIEYVPSSYCVRFRGIPDPIEPTDLPRLLPTSVVDLLGSRLADANAQLRAQGANVPTDPLCPELSTEEARALAEAVVEAGIEPQETYGDSFLRFGIPDPDDPENGLWISFEPMLPHGEPIFLGPG